MPIFRRLIEKIAQRRPILPAAQQQAIGAMRPENFAPELPAAPRVSSRTVNLNVGSVKLTRALNDQDDIDRLMVEFERKIRSKYDAQRF